MCLCFKTVLYFKTIGKKVQITHLFLSLVFISSCTRETWKGERVFNKFTETFNESIHIHIVLSLMFVQSFEGNINCHQNLDGNFENHMNLRK